MDIRDLHCVVIGAGIGGLSAAALLARKGMQVTVLEAQSNPGGCAATFSSGDYRFDAGATVGCGFHPGGPMDLFGQELDIRWPVKPESVAWQYRHLDLKLDLSSSRENIIARFPRSVPFWNEQARIARALWRLSAGGLPWPATGIRDFARLAGKALECIPGSFSLPGLVSKTAHDWLAGHGLDSDADFVRFIDAQLLISVQTTSRYANALNAAIALDLPVSGAWRVQGGIGRIAGLLAESVESGGGAVLYGKKVNRIDSIQREVLGVETTDGDALAADLLIANLTPDSFAILDGKPPAAAEAAIKPLQWSAFMLYLGMDAAVFDRAGIDHLQITAAKGELAEGHSIFVSASPADDPSRAPVGQRAVTISTHTRPDLWFSTLSQGSLSFEEMKERYQREVLGLLFEQLPEASGAVRYVSAATPITWELRTGRHHGYVGGYAQTSLFGVRGPSTAYSNLFLAGDSIFPGQSLPGVVTGARRAVELVLRRYGKNR